MFFKNYVYFNNFQVQVFFIYLKDHIFLLMNNCLSNLNVVFGLII